MHGSATIHVGPERTIPETVRHFRAGGIYKLTPLDGNLLLDTGSIVNSRDPVTFPRSPQARVRMTTSNSRQRLIE
jgi:hypothetical protein